jgi:hypothetical protein
MEWERKDCMVWETKEWMECKEKGFNGMLRVKMEWNEKRIDWLAWEEKGFIRMRIEMNGKRKDLWMRRERNEWKWKEEWLNLLSRRSRMRRGK